MALRSIILAIIFFINTYQVKSQTSLAHYEVNWVSWSEDDDYLDLTLWEDIGVGDKWKALKTFKSAPQQSYFKATWDSTALYIVVHFDEQNITAVGDTNHQYLFQMDNCAELFLDMGADGLNYYELQVNAGNIRWELTLDKAYSAGGQMSSPDELSGLETTIFLDGTLDKPSDRDQSWTIIYKMPWSSLQKFWPEQSLPNTSVPIAINLSRVVQQHPGQLYYTWSPMTEVNIHMPEQWGRWRLVK